MTRNSLLFIVALVWAGTTVGRAQAQVAVSDTSIVQYLERPETGGKVKVVQPAELAERVSRAEGVIKYDGNKGYAQSSGFRIQVFSDNNYRTAKNNALYKEGLIKQAFPEMETYVTFTSPFWRLRVGDFRSYEEAGNALRELKREFPQMAREMRVVRDKIHIQIHQGFTE
ncbi:SPOR domain-containing protein [Barnesiella viscericola]|uniref:SPOR domain-containing protein n=1 Tax=Barnesiella viscericola TaxID=397865 RepID=A0A921SUQ1_9BACT|nr:SPOR domain-containing protein [Barnesiella viscericola]HJG88537.1 SPOR domain-containing protein [Barnesiella viscericola]